MSFQRGVGGESWRSRTLEGKKKSAEKSSKKKNSLVSIALASNRCTLVRFRSPLFTNTYALVCRVSLSSRPFNKKNIHKTAHTQTCLSRLDPPVSIYVHAYLFVYVCVSICVHYISETKHIYTSAYVSIRLYVYNISLRQR
jgi:hypothetical protein